MHYTRPAVPPAARLPGDGMSLTPLVHEEQMSDSTRSVLLVVSGVAIIAVIAYLQRLGMDGRAALEKQGIEYG